MPDSVHGTLPEEAQGLLRERARYLARPAAQAKTALLSEDNDQEAYVGVRLLDEPYGLPLDAVREAVPLHTIVPVPGVPAHVAGLVRIRGRVLALVDLRRFWREEVHGHADSDLAIVVETGGVEFGVMCTAVQGLIRVEPTQIAEVPRNLPPRLAVCLRGVTSDMTMLVALDKLLVQQGFLVDSEAKVG